MRKALIIICLLLAVNSFSQQLTKQQYREDFDFFWTTIRDNYCYWEKRQTDWQKVKEVYGPLVDTITNSYSFIMLMEKVFYELYDHHASLNRNTRESQRLVPSGADIWAEYQGDRAIVTALRAGFGAEKAGMHPGMEIQAFNGVDINKAIQPLMPRCLKKDDIEAKNYALRTLLAGKHSETRRITVRNIGGGYTYSPDSPVNLLREYQYPAPITSRIINGTTGYICINNRLGDNGLIAIFDSVLQSMKNTTALILDLRATPSGGNTTVARAILGSFISKEGFYQKHEWTAEEMEYGIKRSWVEIVSPRKYIYSKPLVLLVGRWTGSVGEGITIGFDALKRATVIGTPMAQLMGGIYNYTMPNTGIGFSFPAEKLFHVNGQPRENFKPSIIVDLTRQEPGQDFVLQAALNFIKKKK